MNPNWVSITTSAREQWEKALRHWQATRWDHRTELSERQIVEARRRYRETILGAFWGLLVPLQPNKVVPNEVANLLAEEWDITTSS